jgi:hypothetical protein
MNSVNECDGGGCAVSPNAVGTLNTTQGVGNAVPAQMAAMTAAEQTDPKSFGSGDRWGTLGDKNTKPKRRKNYYIARRKGKKYLKVHENLNYEDAVTKLLEMNDSECKIYLMADGNENG